MIMSTMSAQGEEDVLHSSVSRIAVFFGRTPIYLICLFQVLFKILYSLARYTPTHVHIASRWTSIVR